MPYPILPHQHGEGPQTARIQAQLEKTAHFQTIADIFKQLGDPTRVRIFWLLCHCEECVVNISAMLGMSSPAVSHHLRPLRDSGLVTSRREGKEVYYRAADTAQSRLLHRMMEQVMEIACPEALPEEPSAPCTACSAQGQEPSAPCTACSAQAGASYRPQTQPPCAGRVQPPALAPDQLAVVHAVHDQLLRNMEQRVTIEALSKQHHINPTTLKTAFKAVYGTSIAAHIRQHRLEQAAGLLRQTDMSVADIARAVGYDSQSRLTAAFKSYFHAVPMEYRKSARLPAGQKEVVLSDASEQAVRKAQAAFSGAAEAMGISGEEDVQTLVDEVRCGKER